MGNKKTDVQAPAVVQKPDFDVADTGSNSYSEFDKLMTECENIEAKSQAMEEARKAGEKNAKDAKDTLTKQLIDEAKLTTIDEQKRRALEQVKREEAKRNAEEERAKNGASKKKFGLSFVKKGATVSPDTSKKESANEYEADYGMKPDDDIISDLLDDFGTPLEDEFPDYIPDEDDFIGAELDEELIPNTSSDKFALNESTEGALPELQPVVSITEPEPVNIPDEIMRETTTKDILRKWTENVLQDVKYALTEYYAKHSDIAEELRKRILTYDYNMFRKKLVEIEFEDIRCRMKCISPLLTDLVHEDIYTIADIFIVVYGMTSDETYLIRHFTKLYNDIGHWSEFFMWNNCQNNKRLARILNLALD